MIYFVRGYFLTVRRHLSSERSPFQIFESNVILPCLKYRNAIILVNEYFLPAQVKSYNHKYRINDEVQRSKNVVC